MREPALLFEPIVDFRDVLESFLADRIMVTNWQATLVVAGARLRELGSAWSDGDLVALGRTAERFVAERRISDSTLAREAADSAARYLDQVRVPGLPRPDDNDLAF